MLGKAFPYPQRVQVWSFARGSRRTEPGYGASRAYKTAQRLQLQHSGSMHPPAQVAAFRVLWGHLRGFSLIVAYADSIEPGSYRG